MQSQSRVRKILSMPGTQPSRTETKNSLQVKIMNKSTFLAKLSALAIPVQTYTALNGRDAFSFRLPNTEQNIIGAFDDNGDVLLTDFRDYFPFVCLIEELKRLSFDEEIYTCPSGSHTTQHMLIDDLGFERYYSRDRVTMQYMRVLHCCYDYHSGAEISPEAIKDIKVLLSIFGV